MALAIVLFLFFVIYKFVGGKGKEGVYPDLSDMKKNNSLLKMFNANHINAIVDHFTSLEAVSKAIRQAGLESSNLIFGKSNQTCHPVKPCIKRNQSCHSSYFFLGFPTLEINDCHKKNNGFSYK